MFNCAFQMENWKLWRSRSRRSSVWLIWRHDAVSWQNLKFLLEVQSVFCCRRYLCLKANQTITGHNYIQPSIRFESTNKSEQTFKIDITDKKALTSYKAIHDASSDDFLPAKGFLSQANFEQQLYNLKSRKYRNTRAKLKMVLRMFHKNLSFLF